MPFPLIESINIWQIDRFSITHFVRCPILESFIGISLYRVSHNSSRRIGFQKTLIYKQVYTTKQTKKKKYTNQRLDEPTLSWHHFSLCTFQKPLFPKI